jgi:anti-sigma factor RsiW
MEVSKVNCAEAKDRFLEAAEGDLKGDGRGALEEHLVVCEACRTEFDELGKAVGALREAVGGLAPVRRYLTAERRERLMAAYADEPKLFRLITYRRFIAAAAAVAIVVSGAVIATSVARMTRSRPKELPVAAGPVAAPYVPVILAATGQGGPVNVIRSIPVGTEAWSQWDEPARGARIVRTDSAGVRIPVDHAFYDPEESSHWW